MSHQLRSCCFLIGLCVAAGSHSGAQAPADSERLRLVQEYNDLRMRYISQIESLPMPKALDSANRIDVRAFRELVPRLRAIVGAFTMPGIVGRDTIQFGTLQSGNIDFDAAPGLEFRTRDSVRVFVTDTGVFHTWSTLPWYSKHPPESRELDTLMAGTDVYSGLFAQEAAVYRYATLPLAARGKHLYNAMLIHRAQDDCDACIPNEIIVAAQAGPRIVILEAPVRNDFAPPAKCAQEEREFWRGRSSGIDDRGFQLFLRCYEREIRSMPVFSRLAARAQAMFDAIPDR